jgi:hypothetical protein
LLWKYMLTTVTWRWNSGRVEADYVLWYCPICDLVLNCKLRRNKVSSWNSVAVGRRTALHLLTWSPVVHCSIREILEHFVVALLMKFPLPTNRLCLLETVAFFPSPFLPFKCKFNIILIYTDRPSSVWRSWHWISSHLDTVFYDQ